MVELSLKNKKLPRLNLMQRNGSTKKQESRHYQSSLGSGINSYNNTVSNSIIRNYNNDPYMPHIAGPQRSSSSLPQTSRPPKHPMRHHSSSSPYLPATRSIADPLSSPHPASPSNTFYYNYPPLSPPPLSPTNLSFATSSRPSWREMTKSPTYQPASSISSTDDDEDDEQDQDDSDVDDNAPLGLMLSSRPVGYGKPFSLLSDLEEDGDDDLVPIARLSISRESVHHMSAAEKYKQKVRARLQMGNSTATAATVNPFL
ncbi:hypothetical protein HMPREF1544_02209 [Mucor circinelloides 1006PhL]|uniref:Uncharacterized protein n=1 Tax=Mucor circinelloides f. circinelloides (strain 1006PhL) TaxID=1220926 RepID=S2KF52_MUCC1|nr:hypothetical protein HMPREF1544_02209 [Mucor circinelloides 1006PhL]